MSFFDQVYQRLFSQSKGEPIEDHRLLKRNNQFQLDFDHWISSERKTKILDDLRNSWILKQKELDQEPSLYLLVTNSSNGIAISFSPYFEKAEFAYLLDYFGSRILDAFPYKKANNDVRVSAKKNSVETIERLYLKPKTNFSQPINQYFGNILLENIQVDDQPQLLKIVANTYSDRNYSDPDDFVNLASHLFSNETT